MTRLKQSGILVALALTAAATLAGCASTRGVADQADDTAITAAVKAKFAGDPEVKAHEIDVDTVDGTVILTGKVDSDAVRAEAVKLARKSHGVRAVRDNLRVGNDPTVGEHIDDVGIATRLKLKLADDPGVRARDVDVDSVEGVVTLTGKVRTWSERTRAEQIALQTSGVKHVHNRLEVVG